MCDFSEKMIAWLDRELPENEARDVERHIQACAECRSRLDSYKEIDQAFHAYCDKTMESAAPGRLSCWVPVLSGAVAAAVLLLLFPRGHVEHLSPQVPVAAASPVVALEAPLEKTLAPITKPVHKRHVVAPAQSQNADWMPMEPAIQIAIPAEAIFAPGAVPQGVSFTAELSIAADGSAQQLRLRP